MTPAHVGVIYITFFPGLTLDSTHSRASMLYGKKFERGSKKPTH